MSEHMMIIHIKLQTLFKKVNHIPPTTINKNSTKQSLNTLSDLSTAIRISFKTKYSIQHWIFKEHENFIRKLQFVQINN